MNNDISINTTNNDKFNIQESSIMGPLNDVSTED